ncbi:Heme oxygenase [Klenkia marina]|uniref:Heme oxygenase n=1 Tax=Klenkia marina TaxID=1960309 RepID=A0A1G4Z5E3_9ACTN|nr:biliverdin-producing heme oxygenase [Klenkia marina]SCX60870.1 Heme oxygenase [Klenkia marina]
MTRQPGTDVLSPVDVMLRLRTATAPEHQQLEDTLDLLSPDLTPGRLAAVLQRMHAYWAAVEAGLDAWAAAHPAAATALDWAARRRTHLFTADLAALGAAPLPDRPTDVGPPAGTDEALGTLYVLEGSTLGGVFIDRHLAALPALAGVGPLAAFSPYGERTGARWAAFRRATRDHVAHGGGDADAVVSAAGRTFRSMAAWCRDVQQSASPTTASTTHPGGGVPA